MFDKETKKLPAALLLFPEISNTTSESTIKRTKSLLKSQNRDCSRPQFHIIAIIELKRRVKLVSNIVFDLSSNSQQTKHQSLKVISLTSTEELRRNSIRSLLSEILCQDIVLSKIYILYNLQFCQHRIDSSFVSEKEISVLQSK